MRRSIAIIGGLLLAGTAACYYPHHVYPYESCGASNDVCSSGLACAGTTLPASSGYTGSLCTSGCNFDSDCLQVPSGFAPSCINDQCYLTCPSSEACPYGQACLTFQDQTGAFINLCTP